MRPIFLIGFMCSGKTTIGRALGERLGMTFIDLDQFIEARTGMTVSRIFESEGEAAFRRRESEALAEVASRSDVIVACGGGTPCQPGAMDLMNASGTTVRLVPSERRLLKRLMSGRRKRPLIASISSRDEMYDFMVFTGAKREEHYSKAQYRFDSTALDTTQEVEATVEEFISSIINNVK